MLLLETFIDLSPGKGIGLFAKENISKGTKYWIRNEIFDNVFTPLQITSLEKITIDYIKKHGFLEVSGNWYLCGDNARFSNHSNDPNSRNIYDENNLVQYTIAVRDIKTGEEISCDYQEICWDCKEGLNFKNIKI